MKAQKEAALCNELRREMKGTEGFTEHKCAMYSSPSFSILDFN